MSIGETALVAMSFSALAVLVLVSWLAVGLPPVLGLPRERYRVIVIALLVGSVAAYAVVVSLFTVTGIVSLSSWAIHSTDLRVPVALFGFPAALALASGEHYVFGLLSARARRTGRS